MKKAKITIYLAILLAIAASTHAEDFTLTNNEHLDITTDYYYGYLYDFSTANIFNGGYINDAYVYDQAILSLSGGTADEIETHNDSVFNFTSGRILEDIDAYDNSTINIFAGVLEENINAYDNSIVNMSGGDIDYLRIHNLYLNCPQRASITGGKVRITPCITLSQNQSFNYTSSFAPADLAPYGIHTSPAATISIMPIFAAPGQSNLAVASGTVRKIETSGTSNTTISGGLTYGVSTNENSIVNISDGTVESIYTQDNSTINFSGGSNTAIYAHGNSNINFSGGDISLWIEAYQTSKVNVSGGNIPALIAYNDSTVDVSDGTIRTLGVKNLRLNGPQRVNVTGGSVANFSANIALEQSEHLDYSKTYTLSDLTPYGVQVAPATVGSVSTAFTTRDSSTLNISGGSVNYLQTYNNSTVDISDASVGSIASYDDSLINISSVTMPRSSIHTSDNSTLNMSGGTISLIVSRDDSKVNFSGGNIEFFEPENLRLNSPQRISITGGHIEKLNPKIDLKQNEHFDYQANFSNSDLNQFGIQADPGIIDVIIPSFTLKESSSITVSGGDIRRLDAYGSNILRVTGGYIGYLSSQSSDSTLYISDQAIIEDIVVGCDTYISGGSFSDFGAYGRSNVFISGYDFILGQGLSWDIDGKTILGTGSLFGKWFDGTAFEIPIRNRTETSTITAIPEPATLLLLTLGGLTIIKKRKT